VQTGPSSLRTVRSSFKAGLHQISCDRLSRQFGLSLLGAKQKYLSKLDEDHEELCKVSCCGKKPAIVSARLMSEFSGCLRYP